MRKGLLRFLMLVKHWPYVLAMNLKASTLIFMRNYVENQDSSRFTPSERPETGATVNDESWRKMFIWLGEQKPNSVVFAGFGSKTKLNKNQIREIAYGLELSGHCRFSGLSGNLVELILMLMLSLLVLLSVRVTKELFL